MYCVTFFVWSWLVPAVSFDCHGPPTWYLKNTQVAHVLETGDACCRRSFAVSRCCDIYSKFSQLCLFGWCEFFSCTLSLLGSSMYKVFCGFKDARLAVCRRSFRLSFLFVSFMSCTHSGVVMSHLAPATTCALLSFDGCDCFTNYWTL